MSRSRSNIVVVFVIIHILGYFLPDEVVLRAIDGVRYATFQEGCVDDTGIDERFALARNVGVYRVYAVQIIAVQIARATRVQYENDATIASSTSIKYVSLSNYSGKTSGCLVCSCSRYGRLARLACTGGGRLPCVWALAIKSRKLGRWALTREWTLARDITVTLYMYH